MGRLVPLKGVDILLSALSFLAQRGLAFEATIGGNGDANAFRRIADEYGIGAQVNFTGWLSGEQVAHTYSESDVFVLPSLIENQPMSILEAMKSEEHTSELQSLMRNSYADFCLKIKNKY